MLYFFSLHDLLRIQRLNINKHFLQIIHQASSLSFFIKLDAMSVDMKQEHLSAFGSPLRSAGTSQIPLGAIAPHLSIR
jgi:hypothetical protein